MSEEQLGSLSGGLRDPWDDAGLGVDETDGFAVAVDAEISGAAPGHSSIPEPQPINQATMECLRGPCVHHWAVVSRYETTVDGVKAKCTRTCTASGYADTPLQDANIYSCDRWWPQTIGPLDCEHELSPLDEDVTELHEAAEVVYRTPPAERGRWRLALREAWEIQLRAEGYDFAWRDFDPATMFSDDDEHQRKFSGVGGYAAARDAKDTAHLPPAAGVPEDDNE